MQSIIRPSAAAAAFALSAILCAEDCPPRTFDYPSFADDEIALIVVAHYGLSDPLVPTQEDYDRASTDVALIRRYIPLLAEVPHLPGGWSPASFFIQVTAADDAELVCLNEYYGATMEFGPEWWLVAFPQAVNIPAMMAVYAKVPAVLSAAFNIYFCQDDCCASSSWGYQERADGTWKWYVSMKGGGGHGGCTSTQWVLTVTADGVVSLSPDLNADDTVDAADLAILLAGWGACTGGYCPADVTHDGAVGPADLAALLAAWGD